MPKGNPKARRKVPAKAAEGRAVKYPEVTSEHAWGDNPVTRARGRELLGWQTEEDAGEGFGAAYDLKDRAGRKVRLTNNMKNRPLHPSVYKTYQQEQLRKRWAGPNGRGGTVNGEPIIVGRTGVLLNGQHQLVALELANQEVEDQPMKWADLWPEGAEVVIDKLVVYGVDEDDATVNTMDTCKPRSLADVIYRSEHFRDLKTAQRRAAARACDYAVRLMWHRTGADRDAFAPRRTHAESLDFVARHPRLLEAVRHVIEEDSGGELSKWLSPGYASAVMYLMAACRSDPDVYRCANPPSEEVLDLSEWDRAAEYWVLLANGGKALEPVRKAVAGLSDYHTGAPAPRAEKLAVIIKSWPAFAAGYALTAADLMINRHPGEDGRPVMAESVPSLGGIDVGGPDEITPQPVAVSPAGATSRVVEELPRAAERGDGPDEGDPTPGQIAERAAAERRRREGRMRGRD